MSRVRLTWNNASTTIVEQRVYRSISPLDIDDMPEPLAVLPRRSREYLDNTIEDGLTYHYAVSSVLPDYSELFSKEIKVDATPVEGDPYWDKVVALLHFDGDLTDETGRIWSTGAPTSIDSVNPIFGTGSLYQNGNGDGFYTSNPIGDPSSHFTIEGFCRIDGRAPTFVGFIRTALYGQCTTGPNGEFGLSIEHTPSPDKILLDLRGGTTDYFYSTVPLGIQDGVPFHFAHTYDGENHRVFIDGEIKMTIPYPIGWKNTSQPFRVGQMYNPSYPQYRHGSVAAFDELRITKGVARYTENFTPPTEPFPNN